MLFVYSGEVHELNAILLEKLGKKHVLTTIPATPSDMASAKHVTEYFRQEGIRARLLGARYYRVAERLRNILKNSRALYLMGGNTFEFLAYAQRIEMFSMLRDFEAGGGIILCESAGSIILSPNIATALIPTTCPDDHTLELESYAGMGRIPFHLSPHYEPDAEQAKHELDELQLLANYSGIPVMVLQDGEGFIMEEQRITRIIGKPVELKPEGKPVSNMEIEGLLPKWAASV